MKSFSRLPLSAKALVLAGMIVVTALGVARQLWGPRKTNPLLSLVALGVLVVVVAAWSVHRTRRLRLQEQARAEEAFGFPVDLASVLADKEKLATLRAAIARVCLIYGYRMEHSGTYPQAAESKREYLLLLVDRQGSTYDVERCDDRAQATESGRIFAQAIGAPFEDTTG